MSKKNDHKKEPEAEQEQKTAPDAEAPQEEKAPETEAPEQQPETGSPYIEGNGSYDDFFRYFFGGSPFGN